MLNGKGFYQLHGDTLLYGPNFVENQDFQLYSDKHDQYEYPVGGWYWFEDEIEARNFFSLPLPFDGITSDQPQVISIQDGNSDKPKGYYVFYPGEIPPSLTQ